MIDESEIDKKINKLERSLLSVYDDSEDFDNLLIPDNKAIEANIRNKIKAK
jgi:hypothetical protein